MDADPDTVDQVKLWLPRLCVTFFDPLESGWLAEWRASAGHAFTRTRLQLIAGFATHELLNPRAADGVTRYLWAYIKDWNPPAVQLVMWAGLGRYTTRATRYGELWGLDLSSSSLSLSPQEWLSLWKRSTAKVGSSSPALHLKTLRPEAVLTLARRAAA